MLTSQLKPVRKAIHRHVATLLQELYERADALHPLDIAVSIQATLMQAVAEEA